MARETSRLTRACVMAISRRPSSQIGKRDVERDRRDVARAREEAVSRSGIGARSASPAAGTGPAAPRGAPRPRARWPGPPGTAAPASPRARHRRRRAPAAGRERGPCRTGSASTGPGSPIRRPSWSRDTRSDASRRSSSIRARVSSSTSCSESLCTAAPETTRARATARLLLGPARPVRRDAGQLLVLRARRSSRTRPGGRCGTAARARRRAALSSSAPRAPEIGELPRSGRARSWPDGVALTASDWLLAGAEVEELGRVLRRVDAGGERGQNEHEPRGPAAPLRVVDLAQRPHVVGVEPGRPPERLGEGHGRGARPPPSARRRSGSTSSRPIAHSASAGAGAAPVRAAGRAPAAEQPSKMT